MSSLSSKLQKAPLHFYLIAGFHVLLTIYEATQYIGDSSVYLVFSLRPLILAAYSFFWIGACMMKRWAGLGYLILTLLNVSYHLFAPQSHLKHAISDLLFLPIPLNLFFSFLILFSFKKIAVPGRTEKPKGELLNS